MNDRFSPNWDQVRSPLDSLISLLAGDGHLLVKAFASVASPSIKVSSVNDVKTQLRLMSMGRSTPWPLFDSISALIQSLPRPTRKDIIEEVSIVTNRPYEKLRPDINGRWRVVWQIDERATPEDGEVSLDWYAPPDQSGAPVVPATIIDYVAGSVTLLRGDLVLPSAALLLIALESALWDDLAAKSISRHSDRVTYIPVTWHFKRVGENLVLTTPGGTDRHLRDMDAIVGFSPAQGTCEMRKLYTNGAKVSLQLEVDSVLVGFLASEHEETRETFTDKGLSEAIQRARKAGILITVPSQLDETMVKLRNNLIHLPSRGVLDPPVPDPTGGTFVSLNELQQEPQLVKGLMPLIVELINTIYVTP
jgi:hypothetical protein